MNKLKAIIIDDEELNINTLDKTLGLYCPDVFVIARCSNPVFAIELVNELKPDIVFLDINMPQLNGFEFLNQFKKIKFKIIITTAYSEFALQAIKYAAFDFLLKPIDGEELKKAVLRIRLNLAEQNETAIIQNKTNNTNLALPTSEGFSFIDIFEILYCKSDNSYTDFILRESTKVVVCRGLKETSEMLERHNFFRIHQSFLVNAKYIRKFNKHNNMVVVSNGEQLPVSTRKKEDFLEFIGNYYLRIQSHSHQIPAGV